MHPHLLLRNSKLFLKKWSDLSNCILCTAQLVWEFYTAGMRTIGIPWWCNDATFNFSITKFNIWVILTFWRMLRICHSLQQSTSSTEIRHTGKWQIERTPTLTSVLGSGIHSTESWAGFRPRHGAFEKGTNVLTLPGIKPRFLGCTARKTGHHTTELSRP